MSINLLSAFDIWLGILSAVSAAIALSLLTPPRRIMEWFRFLSSDTSRDVYQTVFAPYQNWLRLTLVLLAIDLVELPLQKTGWVSVAEFIFALLVAINVCLLGFTLFDKFFGVYMLDMALRSGRKVNNEVLVIIRFAANAVTLLITVFLFAQTHSINLIGLLASLGIGGIAIAFASQKVLEHVLWSIVLYLDRPFTVEDYIHLNDGTFGRVESIGWRSTKVRLSGKGTLIIIPNGMLTQMSIENLSGAKKLISIIYLTFFRAIPEEERALIRQVIIDGIQDINGLDNRLTHVDFEESLNEDGQPIVNTQVTLFILGSGEASMELSRQLISVAKQNIMAQLKGYGITFEIEERAISISSPMNI